MLQRSVVLHDACFNPYEELSKQEQAVQKSFPGKVGASASFVGKMRDCNGGNIIQNMHLEHYPGMTEKILASICDMSIQRYRCYFAAIHHRVGDIGIDESIVLVAVWSCHRAEAFAACQAMMESLKADAPFWKQETLQDQQQRWVKSNTSGEFVE